MKANLALSLSIALGALTAFGCGEDASSGSSLGADQIAFSSRTTGNYSIYAMNASDGSGKTQLTGSDANAYGPAWSPPDGQDLAFFSDATGKSQIYRMQADGGAPAVPVTDHDSNQVSPTWSPDGLRLAFASDRNHIHIFSDPPILLTFEIFVIDRDGNNETQITSDPDPGDTFQPTNTDPDWSTAANRITFVSNRDLTDRQLGTDIYAMDADGSNLVNLTQTPSDTDSGPTWSPDGSRIAFTSNRAGQNDIFVMNADGTGQANLTNSFSADESPSWSPDGTQIAFETYRNAKWEIYVMNASDGSGQESRDDGSSTSSVYPAWSPAP